MIKPKTQYTKSGRINIAYQVFGNGDRDLVYIPGWISNIDLMWHCPQLVDFLWELGKVCRVILFDKRGTGLSDRVSDLSPLEERMDDIRAVMDAVGSERAILFGHSEGGSVSALFSATYPDRTLALITFGVFAKRRWSPDYPWAPTDEERQEVYDMIENHWGSGEMNLDTLAPSMANDRDFMDWLAQYFRSGASPSAAMALTKMNTQIDVIDILGTISVPSLLMQRTHDIDVKIEEGRFIAERIQDSKFVEFPGNDHLFWVGNSKEVLDEMINFIQNDFKNKEYDKVLSTLLKLKIHNAQIDITKIKSFENIKNDKNLLQIIKTKVAQYRGQVFTIENNTVTATFSGPSKAVNCAMEIQNISKLYPVDVSQGLHIGEVIFISKNELGGNVLNITSKIVEHAKPNEILITNTINSLLSGTGLDFDHYGVLSASENRKLDILLLKDIMLDEGNDVKRKEQYYFSNLITKNHSFLENVLQSIETHMNDEEFSIHILSRELGMSQRQLQRKIKSITNKSPNTLIRSVRLHKAKELILQERKSVKEAAYLTGFNSISYFSNCFKKEFGETPSNF